MDNVTNKYDRYYQILSSLVPQYEKMPDPSQKRNPDLNKFASESKIKIIGVHEYRPYDPVAIKLLHSFLRG